MLFQVFINSIIVGSIYALVGVGFVLTYITTKFLNFAHGATILIAAYTFFAFFNSVGWLGAFILSIIFAILFNLLLYILIFKKIMKKASKVILLLISFAIMILIENVIQIIFSPSPQSLNYSVKEKFIFFGARITSIEILIIFTTILVLIITWVVFKKTKIGLALRAVADHKGLAEIYGINSDKIILWSFIIAGILGSIAGTMITLEYVLLPTTGSYYMIKGFVGVVTGGLTSVYGSIFGGYLLGLFENYGSWFLLSSYRDAIAFILLFLVLLIKPRGLFGNKGR